MPNTRLSRPWSRSPDPEVFGDGEWAVEKVISEEVDAFGKSRYEIKWSDWAREDGSNTTWQSDLVSEDNAGIHPCMERWLTRVVDNRALLANEDLSVRIQDTDVPTHLYRTVEVAHAYQEKLEESARTNAASRYMNWPGLQPITQSDTSTHRSSSRTRDSVAPSTQSSNSRASSVVPRNMPTSTKRRLEQELDEPNPKRVKVVNTKQKLLKKWLETCREARAASLRIRNDFDNEEVPPLSSSFVYLEDRYDLGDLAFEDDKDYLAGCECNGSCDDPEICDCQTIISDGDMPTLPYDENGLFQLDRIGNTVVECNQYCKCSTVCRNRVAQKARDVEIEIFRTTNRGWGARATRDVPKGRYFGLYTGRLITREKAARLPDAHRSYTFDLDALDNGRGVPAGNRFSVDAYEHGNWTRFVNHSCDPNVKVYSVMWNTTPEMNRPYLAFVANQDIPARTELTIDYDPKAAFAKGKRRRPPGSKTCSCGSQNCRGWIAV